MANDDVRSDDIKDLLTWMQANHVAKIEVDYNGRDGEHYNNDSSDWSAEALDSASAEIKAACRSREIFRGESSNGDPIHSVIEWSVDDVISAAGHDGWEKDEGGKGNCSFRVDGLIELKHSDYFVESVDSKYAIDSEGQLTETTPPSEAPASTGLPDVQNALLEALAMLKDMKSGWPEDELHKPPEQLLTECVDLLRSQGVELDEELLAFASDEPADDDASAPGM